MSKQFNNQRCSKCYQTYSGLKATCYDSSCNHEHFFKKNGQLFCVCCLMREGSIKCQKCSKIITRLEEMGKWRRNVVLVDDHTYDINNFGCECRECNHSENEKKKLKRCQGTFSVHYKWKGSNATSTQYNQCDLAVPIDGGDFCQHCKGQTETYQQLRARIDKEQKQSLEKFCQAMDKAQKYWDSLSSSEREKECERLVENIKLGEYWCGERWADRSVEGYCSGWAHNWRCWEIRNGKFTSTTPHLVPVELGEEFLEKESGDKELVLRDHKIVKKDNNDKDNSPPPNLTSPSSSGLITDTNDKSDNSVNPVNSPQSSQGKDKTISDVKTIEFESKEDNSEKAPSKSVERPNKGDIQNLIINLRNIKKITLTSDGNLVIEFNKLDNDNSEKIQTITAEQIKKSQELQTIKSYCKKNGRTSLSQQELNSIISGANTTATQKPKDNNNILLIGIISVTLIFGTVIGLLLLLKKKKVRKN